MKELTVSVVLGSYNRYEFLQMTLDSIRAELADIKHEIIIVDGGSDDGTLDWLMQQKDVIAIVQHNRGIWNDKPITRRSWGYFMNLAFKAAQGTYVCMLSDDCLIVPGAITNAITYFDQQRNDNRNVGALAFYWRDWSQAQTYHIGNTLGDKLYVNHGLFLNEALRDVQYIDEDTYFFYNGDGDLCLKLWNKGYEVLASEGSYIEHYPHANVAVRKTNYDQFKQDLKNYLAKWEGVFYDPRKNNVGSIIEKSFDDTTHTAEQFSHQHTNIIASQPHLVRRKPWYYHGAKKVIWMLQAARRKMQNLLGQ